jgi:hypothetical protein
MSGRRARPWSRSIGLIGLHCALCRAEFGGRNRACAIRTGARTARRLFSPHAIRPRRRYVIGSMHDRYSYDCAHRAECLSDANQSNLLRSIGRASTRPCLRRPTRMSGRVDELNFPESRGGFRCSATDLSRGPSFATAGRIAATRPTRCFAWRCERPRGPKPHSRVALFLPRLRGLGVAPAAIPK